jgi:hypothetical protein
MARLLINDDMPSFYEGIRHSGVFCAWPARCLDVAVHLDLMRYRIESPRLGAPRAESLPRRRSVYPVRHEVTDTDTAAAIGSGGSRARDSRHYCLTRVQGPLVSRWCRHPRQWRPPDLGRRVCQRPLG